MFFFSSFHLSLPFFSVRLCNSPTWLCVIPFSLAVDNNKQQGKNFSQLCVTLMTVNCVKDWKNLWTMVEKTTSLHTLDRKKNIIIPCLCYCVLLIVQQCASLSTFTRGKKVSIIIMMMFLECKFHVLHDFIFLSFSHIKNSDVIFFYFFFQT